MNEKEYEGLSKQAEEALKAFRQIQSIKNIKGVLGEISDTPVAKVDRLQFEIEFEAGGMIQRKIYSMGRGDLFFPRAVREFLAMVNGVKKDAESVFEKL